MGPYEEKVVLEQGRTEINGPHQGALVDLPDDSWWFLHFQDCGPFGRIVHLQPVCWQDGWPLMGEDHDGNGVGEPVARWKKPVAGQPVQIPATSDNFDSPTLGLQWQWHANHEPSWFSLSARPGWLRLFSRPYSSTDISRLPHFLGQKFPAREFSVATTLDFSGASTGAVAGLAVVGGSGCRFLALRKTDQGQELILGDADGLEVLASSVRALIQLRVGIRQDGSFHFGFADEPGNPQEIPGEFRSSEGGWIGAKVGLFHSAPDALSISVADFDDFQFLPAN
jgi:hypothetical protein